jgi:hypothetical protein
MHLFSHSSNGYKIKSSICNLLNTYMTILKTHTTSEQKKTGESTTTKTTTPTTTDSDIKVQLLTPAAASSAISQEASASSEAVVHQSYLALTNLGMGTATAAATAETSGKNSIHQSRACTESSYGGGKVRNH